MIFVTVGTHEQPFNRLIRKVDEMVENKIITEPVMMQIGYTDYLPKYCKYSRFLSYPEMMEYENKANIVITHGGPSTFMSVLSKGKVPIVVPRQHKFHEHINDHQLIFSEMVKRRGYPIIVVKDINTLNDAISEAGKSVKVLSHNQKFVQEFAEVVAGLLR